MENIQVFGDVPTARFGHTATKISANKIIIFGGAVGDIGKYSISDETFCFDTQSLVWKKLTPDGISPSPRAAHAATSVEKFQMILYGGASGGGGLVPDDLFLLDLKDGEAKSKWIQIPTIGNTPGRRYGHTLVYRHSYLIVYGGNIGNEAKSDVWTLNVEKAPFQWVKVEVESEIPPVRVYHSAATCLTGSASGMVVIFGGRSSDQSALSDLWGFRKHRNGKWDWVKAPSKANTEKPQGRFQHISLFAGSLLLIVGGRTNNMADKLSIDIYDTDSAEWNRFNLPQRFRHGVWIYENFLFCHGGFSPESPNKPTSDLFKISLGDLFVGNAILTKALGKVDDSAMEIETKKPGGESKKSASEKSEGLMKNFNIRNVGQGLELERKNSDQRYVRLAPQAVIAFNGGRDNDNGYREIRKLSINKLQEEAKKLGLPYMNTASHSSYESYANEIAIAFINELLIPESFDFNPIVFEKKSILELCEEVKKVVAKEPTLLKVRSPIKIFGNIHGQFGDLMKMFGHFGLPSDMYKGDIDGFDYLFLGDYVDYGKFGLETVCLLFALKLKYPDQVHLIRGHHEDRKINKIFGFAEECVNKLGDDLEDIEGSVYHRINQVFELLPLAALVDKQIFCVHGGIGNTLQNLEEIVSLKRPIDVAHDPTEKKDKIVLDLLWSDPVLEETQLSDLPNPGRDIFQKGHICKFGFQRIQNFLNANNLSLIIRSHESVPDGFEKMGDQLMTIFSASDYQGKMKNACGCIAIKKSEIVPKLILSSETVEQGKLERWSIFQEQDELMGSYEMLGKMGQKGLIINSVWFDEEEVKLKQRSGTPPRLKTMVKKH